jgi:hypothetical protein
MTSCRVRDVRQNGPKDTSSRHCWAEREPGAGPSDAAESWRHHSRKLVNALEKTRLFPKRPAGLRVRMAFTSGNGRPPLHPSPSNLRPVSKCPRTPGPASKAPPIDLRMIT